MTPERLARVIAVLNKRQPDLTVLMDEVNKPNNLAAIVRTCDAVGVGHIHAISPSKRTKYGHHSAGGSTRWVQIQRHDKVEQAIALAKQQGMQVVATQLSERAKDFREVDYAQPTCIIVGAEKFGVSETAATLADHHVIIPMDGMVQSLNVSVATAIVLYEAERQKRNAGHYQSCRLPDAEIQRLMVEWLHPQVAKYCRDHALPYPAISSDGELAHKPGESDDDLPPEDGMY